ncbi:hypothetical protein F9Z84_06305 [Escherichia coli]|nr:hypothetical protein F9Z84_06305 [Escherichia coli]
MNIFLRELTNRLISYLIRVSKGDTNEERIEHLLRKTLLFALMAMILAATMTSKYLVTGWYMNDLEKSVEKIDTFMGTQQENMNQLFRINGEQYTTIMKLSKENQDMRNDILTILKSKDEVERENRRLKTELELKGKK